MAAREFSISGGDKVSQPAAVKNLAAMLFVPPDFGLIVFNFHYRLIRIPANEALGIST